MQVIIDEYTCDWKDCKESFTARNRVGIGDRVAPFEWGHGTFLHIVPTPDGKCDRVRRTQPFHLCRTHAEELAKLMRHEEKIEE